MDPNISSFIKNPGEPIYQAINSNRVDILHGIMQIPEYRPDSNRTDILKVAIDRRNIQCLDILLKYINPYANREDVLLYTIWDETDDCDSIRNVLEKIFLVIFNFRIGNENIQYDKLLYHAIKGENVFVVSHILNDDKIDFSILPIFDIFEAACTNIHKEPNSNNLHILKILYYNDKLQCKIKGQNGRYLSNTIMKVKKLIRKHHL